MIESLAVLDLGVTQALEQPDVVPALRLQLRDVGIQGAQRAAVGPLLLLQRGDPVNEVVVRLR